MHPDQATEQQRAADYQASCAARRAFISARAIALAGTEGSDVADAWRPLLEALGDQTSVCDNTARDVAQLGQLT